MITSDFIYPTSIAIKIAVGCNMKTSENKIPNFNVFQLLTCIVKIKHQPKHFSPKIEQV
jgi:hypothetical protein